MICLAWAKLTNQCWLRHSSRNLPLKLCRKPLCMGLPGSMKSRRTLCRYAQASSDCPANSSPLSTMMHLRVPCHLTSRSSTRPTRAWQGCIDLNRQALPHDGIEDVERAEASSVRQHVLHKIQYQVLLWLATGCHVHAHSGRDALARSSANRQPFQSVEPIDTLAIDAFDFAPEQDVQAGADSPSAGAGPPRRASARAAAAHLSACVAGSGSLSGGRGSCGRSAAARKHRWSAGSPRLHAAPWALPDFVVRFLSA